MNSVLYQNQLDKFQDIRKDYYDVRRNVVKGLVSFGVQEKQNGRVSPFQTINAPLESDVYARSMPTQEKKNNSGKLKLSSIFDAIPMYRRMERVPDKLKQNEPIPALGLVSLAILNGPEDIRDMMSSYKQISSKIAGGHANKPYNNKSAQHPFSFFRGTLLHNLVDPDKTPFPKIGKFLLDRDVSLFDTKIGRRLVKYMGVDTDVVTTNIKNISKEHKFVPAYKFTSGNYFSEIVARAMLRTTKLGAMALGGIEAAHCVKKINDGRSTGSAIARSLVNFTASVAGIGLVGAIGAKHFGPAGSLVGMGLGSVIGNRISSQIDR